MLPDGLDAISKATSAASAGETDAGFTNTCDAPVDYMRDIVHETRK